MRTLQLTINNFELLVEYTYSHDSGKWTLDNGDPGYPESEEIEINKIELLKGKLLDLIEYGSSNNIIEEINLKISEHERY